MFALVLFFVSLIGLVVSNAALLRYEMDKTGCSSDDLVMIVDYGVMDDGLTCSVQYSGDTPANSYRQYCLPSADTVGIIDFVQSYTLDLICQDKTVVYNVTEPQNTSCYVYKDLSETELSFREEFNCRYSNIDDKFIHFKNFYSLSDTYWEDCTATAPEEAYSSNNYVKPGSCLYQPLMDEYFKMECNDDKTKVSFHSFTDNECSVDGTVDVELNVGECGGYAQVDFGQLTYYFYVDMYSCPKSWGVVGVVNLFVFVVFLLF